jgi:hypothetical protein
MPRDGSTRWDWGKRHARSSPLALHDRDVKAAKR